MPRFQFCLRLLTAEAVSGQGHVHGPRGYQTPRHAGPLLVHLYVSFLMTEVAGRLGRWSGQGQCPQTGRCHRVLVGPGAQGSRTGPQEGVEKPALVLRGTLLGTPARGRGGPGS